jgi:hypothetical protein
VEEIKNIVRTDWRLSSSGGLSQEIIKFLVCGRLVLFRRGLQVVTSFVNGLNERITGPPEILLAGVVPVYRPAWAGANRDNRL